MEDHKVSSFYFPLFSVLLFCLTQFSLSAPFRFFSNSAWTWNHPYHITSTHNNIQRGSVLKLTTGVNSAATFDPTRVSQISWRPRVFSYNKFLTDEECDHLINLAKGSLEKSMVVDDETGESVASDVRTSSGMFLDTAHDEVVAGIERKIAAWTFLPMENGEQLQILRYEHGQKYEPHADFFVDDFNVQVGGNRVATVLMYLSKVEKGGETIFPASEAKDFQRKNDTWSDCAKKGYGVKPEKGDALLFYNLHINLTADPLSYHGSCPVTEGEKWSATKWIHEKPYKESVEKVSWSDCIDEDDDCALWAKEGECETNPLYMVGTKDDPGACSKSCNACSS